MKPYSSSHNFYFPFRWTSPLKNSKSDPKMKNYWSPLITNPNDSYPYVNNEAEVNESGICEVFISKILSKNPTLSFETFSGFKCTLLVNDLRVYKINSGTGIFYVNLLNQTYDKEQELTASNPDDIIIINELGSDISFFINLDCTESMIRSYPLLQRFKESKKRKKYFTTSDNRKLVIDFVESCTDFHITSFDTKGYSYTDYIHDNLVSYVMSKDTLVDSRYNKFFKTYYFDNLLSLGKKINQGKEIMSRDVCKLIPNRGDDDAIISIGSKASLSIMKESNNGVGVYSRYFHYIILHSLIQRSMITNINHKFKELLVKKNDKSKSMKQAEDIYNDYLFFANLIDTENISNNQIISEYYHDLCNAMNLIKLKEDTHSKVNDLFQYITIVEGRLQNKKSNRLNIFAAIAIPASIAMGIFGMNNVSDNTEFIIQLIITAAALIIGVIIAIIMEVKD